MVDVIGDIYELVQLLMIISSHRSKILITPSFLGRLIGLCWNPGLSWPRSLGASSVVVAGFARGTDLKNLEKLAGRVEG